MNSGTNDNCSLQSCVSTCKYSASLSYLIFISGKALCTLRNNFSIFFLTQCIKLTIILTCDSYTYISFREMKHHSGHYELQLTIKSEFPCRNESYVDAKYSECCILIILVAVFFTNYFSKQRDFHQICK